MHTLAAMQTRTDAKKNVRLGARYLIKTTHKAKIDLSFFRAGRNGWVGETLVLLEGGGRSRLTVPCRTICILLGTSLPPSWLVFGTVDFLLRT